ncbi:hypothetical protein G7Y89_g10022 [Cudoniella acicularis]|uniref:Heterokaryon incompatibility domain-containing protein n=1 Tax=Cudoniella acicularis TaxID=354080 RepID=A0A8H4RH88_9HELO|nr:hypothetical protein G7Y89_g10022 [Cudoniella acicularis]
MDYDLDKSFCKLYKGGGQFKQNLLKAMSTQYDREDTPVWAENLQFLTAYPSEDTPLKPGKGACSHKSSTTHDHLDCKDFLPQALAKDGGAAEHGEAEQSCHCVSYQEFDIISTRPGRRMPLRLTSLGEIPGCPHYLAVSYRWPQDKASEEERYEIVLPSNQRRKSNAPAWLLDRIIAYAASQGFKFIWIDQECVDQEDPEQVDQAVKAYHAVYRQSQQIVAVLTAGITEQAHLDAFKFAEKYHVERTQTGTITGVESELRSIMQVSALISEDEWFCRIWTLSESLMASRLLHFLVPCGTSLQRSHWLGNLSGQIVVHQLVLQALFCPIIKPYETVFPARLKRPEREIIQKTLGSERRAIAAYHLFQETCPESKWRLKKRRYLSVIEACRLISGRDGKENSDRIVIMANVCGYKKGLKCPKLVQLKLGLSICTLALSIVNGDGGLLDFIQMECWIGRPEAFSWLPLPVGSVKDAIDSNRTMNNWLCLWSEPIPSFPCESVTVAGLLTSGYLWPMNCHIRIAEIISKIDGFVDRLPLDSMVDCEVIKAIICETLDQVSILAGKNRAVHLCNEVLRNIEQATLRGLDNSDPCETSGPLRFLKEWDEIDEDRTTLHFSEVVESCCLFTDIDHSVADYVFVPYSDSMFLRDGSHFTVALAWNVRLMDCSMTSCNQPLRLRYLGQPEELYLLGSPKRVESVEPQRFLIE